MPGYLGGSTSSGGVGGEIKFPTEFIDPVTKLRVSNPENLIDTDFEYGLQPTKWETVELINNTPSFFSKSGDTTIDGISSITTQAGTREITVTTRLEHGLAVGIPISVSGTKSITADGAYIINSIPNPTTFTYLCKDDQPITASIEDLYSSIITGEFFQGSQLRIQSIVTDNASPISTLTVTTDSTHGFQPNTPFYFLNLNSTISQEFQSANTEAKSFDSSNSATAQTFDGSNTASSINIDLSNSATIGGTQYSIATTDPGLDQITVNDSGAGELQASPVGQPLYYDVVSGSGFFAANPRGVVFLKEVEEAASQIRIKVSEVPDGDLLNITGAMTGFFQLANQARTFAGNNIDLATETLVNIEKGSELVFDGANENSVSVGSPQFDGTSTFVATSTSGTADIGPNGTGWTTNTMLLYQTDGTAATGLVNGETYFVTQCFQVGSTNSYVLRVAELPGGSPINISNDGTGTQTFSNIGISTTKDIFYVPNHNLQQYDMVKYTYPEAGRFNADEIQDFYFVQTVYDNNTFTLTHTLGELLPAYQKIGPVDYGTAITPTSITIVGFVAPYSFTITQGTLPQGLSLNESTGVISGTPTEVYNSSVIVTISDAEGSQGFMEVAFEFTQPPFLYDFTNVTFSSPLSGPSGPSLSQARSSMSGTPTPSNWNTSTANFNMNITGLQRWTVPQDATYRIEAAGAQGGNGGRTGEPGARMRGDFTLTQGDILVIVVGQRGNNGNNGGGGGGTFVWRDALGTNQLPLLAAGGGGGGELNGCSASGGTTSTSGIGDCSGATSGGTNGGDGGGWYSSDQGGRGWNNNDSNNFVGRTQRSYSGGFGGGGGGEGGDNGGGGGGGYSGGGGGRDYGPASGGGGGGSYNGGTNQSNSSAARNGTGYVSITKL